MGFHHVALATKDLAATHRFYGEVMGFELVKVVAGPTPEGGWAKHVFYRTGDDAAGMIAFWELHVDSIGDFSTDLNTGVGLPVWVNHLAFDAPDLDALAAHRHRWQEHGITVVEVDHGFCTSIYAQDPNGTMVEFCCTTRPFTPEEVAWAGEHVLAADVELEAPPTALIHKPLTPAPA